MKYFNEGVFLRDLANMNWQHVLYSSQNINEVILKWTKLLSFTIKKHTPLRERKVSDKFTSWLTSDVECMFRQIKSKNTN